MQVSDDVKAAVAGGMTPETYAKNALIKQREIEARLRGENSTDPGKVAQTPGEQAGQQNRVNDAATETSVMALARELSGRR